MKSTITINYMFADYFMRLSKSDLCVLIEDCLLYSFTKDISEVAEVMDSSHGIFYKIPEFYDYKCSSNL